MSQIQPYVPPYVWFALAIAVSLLFLAYALWGPGPADEGADFRSRPASRDPGSRRRP